jgi:hypothetical protein
LGRWEGDPLVVDRTNFLKDGAFREETRNMHVVERFTRVGENELQYDFTVEDPAIWVRPQGCSLSGFKAPRH